MQSEQNKDIRVFVVWEPVLLTDWLAPSTATLKRLADGRAQQYWDRGRLFSKVLGEKNRKSIVWDRVMVYGRGAIWTETAPPSPVLSVGPVVHEVEPLVAGLHEALGER